MLGELGSSSGSHKGADEDDDAAVLEGDSGASDQGNSSRPHHTTVDTALTTADLHKSDETAALGSFEEMKEFNCTGLPISDMPANRLDSSAAMTRSMLENTLILELERDIAGLLGSIKVQASSIKETLKK